MKKAIGVILGGGRGTRLFPLTKYRSKPAVPIAGKYRLIDIAISNCINSAINKIYVLTQYNSESLNRHINHTYKFDFFSTGFADILAAEQTLDREQWYQGTADSVRQNLHHLLHYDCEYLLILSGDALYRMNFQDMIKHHELHNAEITIAVNIVPQSKTKSLGILKTDCSTRITNFIEKPSLAQIKGYEVPKEIMEYYDIKSSSPHYLCSMGLYLFNKDVLINVLKNKEWVDFGKNVIPASISNHRVYAYTFKGYYMDIGTISTFYKMHMDLLKKEPPFEFFYPTSPIYTHPRFLPNSRIISCEINDSKISEGCVIKGKKITKSILGVRSVVRIGSVLDSVVMMGADYFEKEMEQILGKQSTHPYIGIGKNCYIKKTIIDKNARIGDNVKISNSKNIKEYESDTYFIKDGIVIIPKNALIPSGTII